MKIGNYEVQVPFVTTSSDKMRTLYELTRLSPGDKAIDLGSGDGRVVLELAKWGFNVTGYEKNSDLIKKTEERIKLTNLKHLITLHNSDFWEADLELYNLIYIYGMGSIMGRLEEKFEKEAKNGTILITNIFKLPHKKEKKRINGFYLYIK